MPIVPESRRSRQDVKASISSQFWEQPVHSTKSVDGQLWSLPCEPPALNLTGSSGLSRTQQLLAVQAVRVPFFPSYDGASEGVVLDRVLAKAGGQRWWAALSGRAKAQRVYNLGASGKVRKLDAVRDLSNYALCARGRIKLGSRLTFDGVVEAPDTYQLAQRLRELHAQRSAARAAADAEGGVAAGDAAPADAAGPASGSGSVVPLPSARGPAVAGARLAGLAGLAPTPAVVPHLEPVTAHATLRCALPGHDLSATAGYNLQYIDSTGDAAHVPLAVSLDLASHDRADGLQYRVGLHQVTAPLSEMPLKPGAVQRWRTSLHAQGALAVEGEAHIWRAAAGPKNGAGGEGSGQQAGGEAAAAGPAAKQQQAKGGGGGGEEAGGGGGGGGSTGGTAGGGEEPRRTKLASAIEKAAAADDEPAPPLRKQGAAQSQAAQGEQAGGGEQEAPPADGPAQPAAAPAGAAAEGSGTAAPAAAAGGAWQGPQQQQQGEPQAQQAQQAQGHKLEEFIRPLEHVAEQVSDMLHRHTQPQQQDKQRRGGGGVEEEQAEGAAQEAGGGAGGEGSTGRLLGPLSSRTINATIQDSLALLHQIKESVERLTGNVQDGSLQRLSQQLADSQAAPPRRRPYSMLLSQPHLKLNAALGCLARMPLPALRAFSFPHASLEPLDPAGPGSLHTGGGAAHQRHASTSSLLSRASYSSQLAEVWQPYFKGTALRVFASLGLSGQLGRFTRPWLDYTAASARVDVGLTSPYVVGVVPGPADLAADSSHRPDKHRAFALEGRGAWHALSVSLAQQVVGPVRARVDARFALDPTSVPASEGERSTLKGVLQTALSVRPSLLETVYGFDCVLPGTEGAARLAVWFSPKRRECMAELRLF